MLHTRVYTVLQTHVCVHSAARTRVHTVLLEPLVSIICSLILARDAPTPIVSQVLLTEDGVPPSGVCPLKPGEVQLAPYPPKACLPDIRYLQTRCLVPMNRKEIEDTLSS